MADVLRPVDETTRDEVRTLLRKNSFAALASLEKATAWPWASRVSYALDEVDAPLILISRLSAHYSALEGDERCSLLIGEVGEGDPLRFARVTLVCKAKKITPEARSAARAQFLKTHPQAELYADFADFDFWQLAPQRASFNASFGRAYELSAVDFGRERN